MERDKLLNRACKLVQLNGFVLDGTVVNVDTYGIFFKTQQKTSFIAWNNIRELTPVDGD
jgi:sRNA-binding regulator protein Hfq